MCVCVHVLLAYTPLLRVVPVVHIGGIYTHIIIASICMYECIFVCVCVCVNVFWHGNRPASTVHNDGMHTHMVIVLICTYVSMFVCVFRTDIDGVYTSALYICSAQWWRQYRTFQAAVGILCCHVLYPEDELWPECMYVICVCRCMHVRVYV